MKFNLVGNFDVAGTDDFILHAYGVNSKTFCGVKIRFDQYNWEMSELNEVKDIGCKKCKRIAKQKERLFRGEGLSD
jgi:hypothetical protein